MLLAGIAFRWIHCEGLCNRAEFVNKSPKASW